MPRPDKISLHVCATWDRHTLARPSTRRLTTSKKINNNRRPVEIQPRNFFSRLDIASGPSYSPRPRSLLCHKLLSSDFSFFYYLGRHHPILSGLSAAITSHGHDILEWVAVNEAPPLLVREDTRRFLFDSTRRLVRAFVAREVSVAV